MFVRDALIEACRLAPDDDEPRLVWADAVGGERGELVVIQCDLARGGLAPAEAAARRRRERELLEEHGHAWTGLIGVVPGLGQGWNGFEFRRGFVDAITLQARLFVEHGEAIWQRVPLLRSLTATGLSVTSDRLEELGALLEAPWFRKLRGLHLWQHGFQRQDDPYDNRFEGHGDRVAGLLVGSGVLAHLSELGLGSRRLTAPGVHHLVASGELGSLERLRLGAPGLGGDAVAALLACTPHLEGLLLAGVTDFEALMSALPPLRELSLTGITDQTLAELERSRAAATIETLALTNPSLERGADFQAFPRLRRLAIANERRGELEPLDAFMRDLAVTAPPSLRRLSLSGWYLSADALRIVARALGPQLEELDLHGSFVDLRDSFVDLRDSFVGDRDVIKELRACVAGEVRGHSSEPEI
jgi:hypothetical protein